MDKKKYHLDGYYLGNFKENEDLKSILLNIKNLIDGKIKDGFELVGKYKNSKDLKPDVFRYDQSFIDILFSNDIPKLLKDITGKELYLAHIQLRISFEGGSYMSWHRDTHVYGGKIVGNIPPVHKIIFYPTVNGEQDKKIIIAPGSHRLVFKNKLLDFLSLIFSKKKIVKSSDTQFMLFNTELFHHVVREKQKSGSFRLIYSFAEKEQLANYEGQENLINFYKEKIK